MARPAIGFGRNTREGEDAEAIKRLFTPEFRNRLDAVIPFVGLTPAIIANVVDKFVKELAAQLADRRVHIEVDAAARAWLAEKGYEPLFGARPLARVIEEHIKRPLADELLFGQLSKGGKVIVTIDPTTGKPTFSFSAGPAVALLPPPESDDDEEEKLVEAV